MSAANMLGCRFFCALFGAFTGQTPNSISPSLKPSSSWGSFDLQVFVVSSGFDVPSPMAAWAAENNPDDFVDDGLCLNLVGKNDTIFVFFGSLDSCLVWLAGMKSSTSGLARSYQSQERRFQVNWQSFFLQASLLQVICAATAFLRLSTSVVLFGMFSMSAGATNVLCEVDQGSRKPGRIGSRVEAFHGGKLCWCLHTWWVPRIRDGLQGVRCRYRHSSCVEVRHLNSLPLLRVFCRFLLCVLSWLFPWDPGLSACSGTSDRRG